MSLQSWAAAQKPLQTQTETSQIECLRVAMLFARFPLRGELASAAANDFLEERRLEWQLSKWNRL